MTEESDRAAAEIAHRFDEPRHIPAPWQVTVPPYDADGVVIERFKVTQRDEELSEMRAILNPQRPNRSLVPDRYTRFSTLDDAAGQYTRLIVDGMLWMSDTPAEVRDMRRIDQAMARWSRGSMLIVGLGLGLVLNRAIVEHEMRLIDVVERDGRVIDAVEPHYAAMARERGIVLTVHHSDIHKWRPRKGEQWEIGFFDIWPMIDPDDLSEVARLRKRFSRRLEKFEAWAQDERLASAKRIKDGTGWY